MLQAVGSVKNSVESVSFGAMAVAPVGSGMVAIQVGVARDVELLAYGEKFLSTC